MAFASQRFSSWTTCSHDMNDKKNQGATDFYGVQSEFAEGWQSSKKES